MLTTPTSQPPSGLHPCPVCGETVNLDDREAAVKHMTKDDAHKEHMAKVRTAQFLDDMCATGIIRRC